ncbi:hypothetical protein F4678DRAFT_486823 [Xylaria arbuscula]|nr:hypothetical protein F4678DRAFT_486823 [Xylaria arbuscula]
MDPLGVSASIAGLITAGAKISQILAHVVRKARNAPKEFQHVQVEVGSIQAILGQLKLYLQGTRTASRSRTSLILVDQVIASLATCVATFSELGSFADALRSESDLDILDVLRWVAKENAIKQILTRLESHEASFNLMLTIKQDNAEDKVDRLYDLVRQTLQSNIMLARRLEVFELTQTQTSGQAVGSQVAHDLSRGNENLGNQVNGDREDPDNSNVSHSLWRQFPPEPAFEQLLEASRLRNSEVFSTISSARQTGSWSRLSSLSLSEIPHIGVLAIPIYEN